MIALYILVYLLIGLVVSFFAGKFIFEENDYKCRDTLIIECILLTLFVICWPPIVLCILGILIHMVMFWRKK